MLNVRNACLVVACILALPLSPLFAGVEWSWQSLHPGGNDDSKLFGLGPAGYVGEYDRDACYWDASFNHTILNTAWSMATAIDGSEQVGHAYIGSGWKPMVWNADAGTEVNLTPPGASRAWVEDAVNGVQVGKAYIDLGHGLTWEGALWEGSVGSFQVMTPSSGTSGELFATTGTKHGGSARFGSYPEAVLWNSNDRDDFVNLHPQQFSMSEVLDITDTTQVGYIEPYVEGHTHASLWTGSAESWTDLHPPSTTGYSRAFAVDGEYQAGFGNIEADWGGEEGEEEGEGEEEEPLFEWYEGALVWNGSADSFMMIGDVLPEPYRGSEARDIMVVGDTIYVAGFAYNGDERHFEAILWEGTITDDPPGPGGEVPEPITLLTVGLGSAVLARRLRRRTARTA